MARTTRTPRETCPGSGTETWSVQTFGRGYYPRHAARCPECGRWQNADVTGGPANNRGTFRSHTRPVVVGEPQPEPERCPHGVRIDVLMQVADCPACENPALVAWLFSDSLDGFPGAA